MNDLEYTYAVARIRALEASMLNDSDIEKLVSCRSVGECFQMLGERGWEDASSLTDAESVFKAEEEKTWSVIKAIAPDIGVFDVFLYSKNYHNLKAAVKAVYTEAHGGNIFFKSASLSGEYLMSVIENREFFRLPGNMPDAAREAYETLLHTRDGQLCDIIIDRAMLDAVREAGERSECAAISDYAECLVATSDIKIAVRCAKTGKRADFMKKAMAPCATLSCDSLSESALKGLDAICEYLSQTAYSKGAEVLSVSPSAFERWCDERLIDALRPQKYNAFSAGPLAAYIVARENEIKTVRIIVTGKQNGFSDGVIRERVRSMYA